MKTNDLGKLAIPTQQGCLLIDIQQLIYCASEGNYSRLYLTSNRSHLVCRQLGVLEHELPVDWFMRVHHSHLVNCRFLERYEHDGGRLWLSNGVALPVARRRRGEVLARLKGGI